ncbi:MAG: hypothetical protein PHC66_04560 [Candidatus Nanoarchaeia archaeon]|nr:hypothetical protein [Candidatus Nanoarchaeia archaeon]MDD5239769.1 hypothetical protein [Candidatus Nanoarchaeia archaeon]
MNDSLKQIELMRQNLEYEDSLRLAQSNGMIDAEKEMLNVLSSCRPEQQTDAFRETALVYSLIANHYANVWDYESAEEMKIKEVVGLELILGDLKDKKRKFDANIALGNSYATLSNWQHKQLKKDDGLTKLLAFIKLDEAFNMALRDKSLEFDAQSFEFIENLVYRSPIAMLGKYGEFSKEIFMMTLQAKDLCSTFGVLPYDAAIMIDSEFEKLNVADVFLVRKMIKEGIIKKPENININRKMIAYHKRIDNYRPADVTQKEEYSIVHEDDNAIIWNKNI